MLVTTMLKQQLPLLLAVLAFIWAQPAHSQDTGSQGPAPTGHEIPIMDGEAGSCSVDLTVTAEGKPVYAAKIKVSIVYGLFGVRRLNLEAYTNTDGKVRFKGLPSRVRKAPLYFDASKGDLVGRAAYDPEVECEAKHDVVLQKPGASEKQ